MYSTLCCTAYGIPRNSRRGKRIFAHLDGEGVYDISTGVNFFNHMLEAFSKHSMIDLNIDVLKRSA